jgi:uncharacterized membrane protein
VIITQSRQNAFDQKRAELDYEVNVRTYRTIRHLEQVLTGLDERLSRLEGKNTEPHP